MKKLMIAASLVVATAVTQAATVTWSAGSTKLVDASTGSATTLSSGSIMLVLLSDTTGWSDGKWTATSGGVTELATATIGNSSKNKGTISGSDYSFVYNETTPSDSALVNGDVLGVVFKDTNGNYSQLTYYSTKAAVTDTLTVSGLNSDIWSEEFKFGQAGDGKIVAGGTSSIPEPTSAMLLVLGLCGLALKRKNA